MDALGFVVVLVCGGGVNWADKGLGQPRQVMTAGTYGPSGQLVFEIMTPHVWYAKQHCSEVVLSWHPGCM